MNDVLTAMQGVNDDGWLKDAENNNSPWVVDMIRRRMIDWLIG